MKIGLSTLVLLAAFAAGSSARAQHGGVDNGCTTSPENPTAILGLVGSAGGALVALRSRLRRKP